MGINELFDGENFPVRPDHPDFWRLSEIILQMDGAMDATSNDDEKDAVWNRFVEEKVFPNALYYMAFQRAIRALGLTTAGEARQHFREVVRIVVLYSEAFAVGVAFSERGGRQQ